MRTPTLRIFQGAMVADGRAFAIGPESRARLGALGVRWRQGEHVLVTGGTGSGKTLLARQLDQIRIDRGGYVVVFVCKTLPDDTILENYPARDGWVRWTRWHKRPLITENKILLWPKVEGKPYKEAAAIMRKVFSEALMAVQRSGKWTVHVDEGLFFTDPAFLGFRGDLGMMYSLIRAAKGTLITLAQRPAHLPVTIYPNITHAFVGQASEAMDIKRLADMDGRAGSRDLQRRITALGKHDFLHIDVGSQVPPTVWNLKR